MTLAGTIRIWVDDIWNEYPDCTEDELGFYFWLYLHKYNHMDGRHYPIPALCVAIKSDIESRNIAMEKVLSFYMKDDCDMAWLLIDKDFYL